MFPMDIPTFYGLLTLFQINDLGNLVGTGLVSRFAIASVSILALSVREFGSPSVE